MSACRFLNLSHSLCECIHTSTSTIAHAQQRALSFSLLKWASLTSLSSLPVSGLSHTSASATGSAVAATMCRLFHTTQLNSAGHSKWQNIMHTKAAKDAAKSKLFSKLVHRLEKAVRAGGGPDPNINKQLYDVIQECRRGSMPSATIQNAIERAKRPGKDALKNFSYEIRGPGGSSIVLDIETINLKRSKAEINRILRKYSCMWAERISTHIFEIKGIVRCTIKEDVTTPVTPELALEHAIDVGAEDVKVEESEDEDGVQVYKFICDIQDYASVLDKLRSKLHYDIGESGIEYLAVNCVALREEDMNSAYELISQLEELPDIARVRDNIA